MVVVAGLTPVSMSLARCKFAIISACWSGVVGARFILFACKGEGNRTPKRKPIIPVIHCA